MPDSAYLHRYEWGATLAALVVAVSACSESAIDSLRGQWNGEVVCATDTSELVLALDVFGDVVSGNAYTRIKDSDKTWAARGTMESVERETRCLDDTCSSNEHCIAKGGHSCSDQGLCVGCKEIRTADVLELTLSDENVQIPDPVLELERAGSTRLEGTISSYCPREDRQEPAVTLTKR